MLGKVSGLGIVAVGRVCGESYPDKKWKVLLPIKWTSFSLERPLPVRVLKALGIDIPQWYFRGDMVRIDPRERERIRRVLKLIFTSDRLALSALSSLEHSQVSRSARPCPATHTNSSGSGANAG